MIQALIRAVKVYWYVFAIFAGAGLAALFGRLIDFAVQQLISPDWPQRAQHIGWVLGAVFAGIGQPLGWFSVSVGKASSSSPQAPQEPTSQQVVTQSSSRESRSLVQALRNSLLLGVIGVLLGMLLGATLAGMWISITLSPWAEWVQSLDVGWRGVSNLFLGSVIMLGVTGLLVGLIGTPLGWVNEESIKRR